MNQKTYVEQTQFPVHKSRNSTLDFFSRSIELIFFKEQMLVVAIVPRQFWNNRSVWGLYAPFFAPDSKVAFFKRWVAGNWNRSLFLFCSSPPLPIHISLGPLESLRPFNPRGSLFWLPPPLDLNPHQIFCDAPQPPFDDMSWCMDFLKVQPYGSMRYVM